MLSFQFQTRGMVLLLVSDYHLISLFIGIASDGDWDASPYHYEVAVDGGGAVDLSSEDHRFGSVQYGKE